MSTLREVDFKLQQRKRVQTQHVRYTPTFVPPNARTHTHALQTPMAQMHEM
jgi:hypothetical protein